MCEQIVITERMAKQTVPKIIAAVAPNLSGSCKEIIQAVVQYGYRDQAALINAVPALASVAETFCSTLGDTIQIALGLSSQKYEKIIQIVLQYDGTLEEKKAIVSQMLEGSRKEIKEVLQPIVSLGVPVILGVTATFLGRKVSGELGKTIREVSKYKEQTRRTQMRWDGINTLFRKK